MFTLRRTDSGTDSTAGLLLSPDGTRLCATLERAWLDNKPRESRIPAGTYSLKMKKLGTSRFDDDYRKKFGDFHKGMIEIDGVPGRDEILFHMGNWHHHTQGCVLLGARTEQMPGGKNFQIPPGESRDGYLIAYPLLLKAVSEGGKIAVTDPVPNGAALVA